MTAVIISLLAAGLAALASYLAASRRFAGKINTSEASSLWTALDSALARSDTRTTSLEARVAQLERDNNALAKENITLMRANAEYETTISALRERVEVLEQENESLKKTIRKVMDANGQ